MGADAALRGEIPDAGVRVGAGLGGIVGVQIADCRVLMVGPYNTARSLYPGHKPFAMSEIPPHLDGGNAGTGEGSPDREGRSAGVYRGTGRATRGRGRHEDAIEALEFWGVGLPERKYFDGVLKISAEKSISELWSQYFTEVTSDQQEAIVGAVFESDSPLQEGSHLPRPGVGEGSDGRVGEGRLSKRYAAHCK